MPYAFISYSTKNQVAADTMRSFLQSNGIDVWMAPYSIPAGQKYAAVIVQAVADCACVVLMLSEAAVASEWVPRELERAVNYHKQIIPARIDDVVVSREIELYISASHTIDLRPSMAPDCDAMQNILASVKQAIAQASGQATTGTTPVPAPPVSPVTPVTPARPHTIHLDGAARAAVLQTYKHLFPALQQRPDASQHFNILKAGLAKLGLHTNEAECFGYCCANEWNQFESLNAFWLLPEGIVSCLESFAFCSWEDFARGSLSKVSRGRLRPHHDVYLDIGSRSIPVAPDTTRGDCLRALEALQQTLRA